MSHVLYLSHNGMTEPLGQSQVLPYLRGVVQALRGALRVTLLACEPSGTAAEAPARLAAELAPLGIRYLPLRRRPTPRLRDKVGDSAALLRHALRAARSPWGPPALVHGRGQLPTAVALALRALRPGCRVIYDCRGLLTDEYLDMGHWRRGEPRQRLTAAAETRLLRGADRVVVLTQALRDELRAGPWRARPEGVVYIPCCVDTARFRPDPAARARARAALGVDDDSLLLVFAGSMARYDMAACLRLLAALRARRPARLLLLTRAAADPVRARAAADGLPADALRVVAAAPGDVPGWLAGCDLAAAFLQPWRSSIATSPTKVGEYLAAGLPTAVSAGIADGDRLRSPGLFAAAPGDPQAISALAAGMLALLWDPQAARAAARASALRHFALDTIGVARYRALYEQILGTPRPLDPSDPTGPRPAAPPEERGAA